MAGVVSIEDVIRLYSVLEEQLRRELGEAELRDERKIIKFLSTYSNLTFKLYQFDFYDTFGLKSGLLPLQPRKLGVFSFCQIYARANQNPNSLIRVDRLVKIFVNTHEVDGVPLVNSCWSRFCLVKEACQAIIFEDFTERGQQGLYPETKTYELIVELFSNINNKPFSLTDFGNPAYPLALAVENAAELLATMLLASIDDLYDFRRRVIEKHGIVGLQAHNFSPIAALYKTPRRYIEVISTWDNLDRFMEKLVAARRGYLF